MSSVDCFILIAPMEKEAVSDLNERMAAEDMDGRFILVSDGCYAKRVFQSDVYLCASNYLDMDAFKALFGKVRWFRPDDVQLLTQGEHESRFSAFEQQTVGICCE